MNIEESLNHIPQKAIDICNILNDQESAGTLTNPDLKPFWKAMHREKLSDFGYVGLASGISRFAKGCPEREKDFVSDRKNDHDVIDKCFENLTHVLQKYQIITNPFINPLRLLELDLQIIFDQLDSSTISNDHKDLMAEIRKRTIKKINIYILKNDLKQLKQVIKDEIKLDKDIKSPKSKNVDRNYFVINMTRLMNLHLSGPYSSQVAFLTNYYFPPKDPHFPLDREGIRSILTGKSTSFKEHYDRKIE